MADDRRTTILSINIDNGAAIKRIADLSRAIEDNKKQYTEIFDNVTGRYERNECKIDFKPTGIDLDNFPYNIWRKFNTIY